MMFRSLASLIMVASAAFPATLVRANSCAGTFDFLFFAWTVEIDGLPAGTTCSSGPPSTFQASIQAQGGCGALTQFSCRQSQDGSENFTFTFNQSDFCGDGGPAIAIVDAFGVVVGCSGGPA